MRTLLIAETQPLMREGLKRILSETFFLTEFGEAATTSETLERLRARRWDMLLLNFQIAGHSGFRLLEQIKREHPDVPILLLSPRADDVSAVLAFQHGASGCLTGDTTPAELTLAVSRVASGRKFIAEECLESLAISVSKTTGTPHKRLSNRELEVMALLIAGKTLKEIAAELSVSAKTISTFHTRIREKLKVHTDVELVHYAIEHDLANGLAFPLPVPALPEIVRTSAHPV